MTVAIPEAWIASGATIEIELPRNLACAACGGGGCDACERAGAVSLRGRKEPGETVEITLPSLGTDDDVAAASARVVVMRIPDRGGHAVPGLELPRGNLLLSVRPGPEVPRGVTRLAQPSMPPPPPAEILSTGPGPQAEVPTSLAPRRPAAIAVAVAIAVATIAALWWLRR